MAQGSTKGIPIDVDGTLSDNSDLLVPSQKAVKTYADTKQVALVSGTNIKTINGNSLLGSGNISISGASLADGDYGDVTVSGGGTVITIDNNSVTSAKINDVDGSKVTQSASYRLVTDTEKSTWNGKLDPNTPIVGATKTKITYDADGLVTAGADATTADISDSLNKRYVTDAQLTVIGNTSGTNTGDQTSIVGITGSRDNFDTACTDANFLYVGDITQYTDEMAQDAVGAMVDTTLTYVDGTPSLGRAALTGAITASAGSNTTALGSFTKAQLDGAVSDGNVLYVGDIIGITDGDKGDITVSSSGTVWNIDAGTVGVTELSATGSPSSTTFLRGDNTWATPTASVAYTLNFGLANNLTTGANTNNNNITGFTFNYDANSVYKVDIYGAVSAAATTTGFGFSMDVSTAVTKTWMVYSAATGTTGGASVGYSRADAVSAGVTSGIGEANQDIPFLCHGLLITGANTGSCQVVFRSEVNAAITLVAGTRIIVEKMA